ncbi:cyanamide hydratase [Polychaeton citri CBS 116435]|uniref:Cyanamide hydratase n=1 Tax=Polychaeton citri CBS 116435 TaxID=1314669 RepID=A0A9P4Q7Q3_9PEZI|nr:cyanamide hydratase [Polychaeton citri CBS 116435]
MSKSNVEDFGWNEVPRNRSNLPPERSANSTNVPIDFPKIWPTTEVVQKAQSYAKENLPQETYNHSLRVYCYGHTMVMQHFPSWVGSAKDSFFETWALTCLFHDIGSTATNRAATHMSFEFQGGFIALQQLQSFGAPQAQAESVCEAIIRHQDPGETGTISRMGQLVQLATEFDNMGWQPYLVHEDVIPQVVKQHPRLKWSSCFSSTICAEIDEKPWCHTTALDGFAEAVAGNKLMEPYD